MKVYEFKGYIDQFTDVEITFHHISYDKNIILIKMIFNDTEGIDPDESYGYVEKNCDFNIYKTIQKSYDISDELPEYRWFEVFNKYVTNFMEKTKMLYEDENGWLKFLNDTFGTRF